MYLYHRNKYTSNVIQYFKNTSTAIVKFLWKWV